jgi:hypothetical protein
MAIGEPCAEAGDHVGWRGCGRSISLDGLPASALAGLAVARSFDGRGGR